MSELMAIKTCVGSTHSLRRNYKRAIASEFILRLCHDVLLQVLCFGSRRQLTKLERAGRRFHQIVEYFFGNKPFLRLTITLKPISKVLDSEVDKISITIEGRNSNRIHRNDFEEFPPFLYLDTIELNYGAIMTITKKCELLRSHLQSIKRTLNQSIIVFYGSIHGDHQGFFIGGPQHIYFHDHTKLVEHIRNEVLPLCNSARCYKFNIALHTDKDSVAEVIDSILQMPSINRCSNVDFWLHDDFRGISVELPIETISNWLFRIPDGNEEINCPKRHPRLLKIGLIMLQNVMDIWDALTQNFKKAQFPGQPFILILQFDFDDDDGDDDDDETSINELYFNKTTNEELSIQTEIAHRRIEIKRTSGKEKKFEKYCNFCNHYFRDTDSEYDSYFSDPSRTKFY